MNIVDINNKTILITGCAGFIGGALALRLIEETSANIIGVDNLSDYYDVSLKEYRLRRVSNADSREGRFNFINLDISNKNSIENLFRKYKPSVIVHLAAQAGVRYSIENPDAYVESNIIGFYNMIKACKASKINGYDIDHFLYASSSSVYGNSIRIPYSVDDKTDRPVSFYAATKRINELMAYSYSKLYEIPMTGMRFFTVYGPAGRPDMAYFKFCRMLEKVKPLICTMMETIKEILLISMI